MPITCGPTRRSPLAGRSTRVRSPRCGPRSPPIGRAGPARSDSARSQCATIGIRTLPSRGADVDEVERRVVAVVADRAGHDYLRASRIEPFPGLLVFLVHEIE